MQQKKIKAAVEINPIEVEGKEYCRYEGKRCEWFYIFATCRSDEYNCELFSKQGSDREGDCDLRPKECIDSTVKERKAAVVDDCAYASSDQVFGGKG